MPRRRWFHASWSATFLAGVGFLAWPEPTPPGVLPELARAARELRAREPLYHRTVGPLAQRLAPGLAARFPRVLGVESQAARRRLEACHQWVGWGPLATPALPLMVAAFCDSEHDVRAYAFLSLVHVQAPARDVAALVRQTAADPSVQAAHCARLLSDEDEVIRRFARELLEALGSQPPSENRGISD
jgi:hypothetical protein